MLEKEKGAISINDIYSFSPFELILGSYGIRSNFALDDSSFTKYQNEWLYLGELIGHDIQMDELKDISVECLDYCGIINYNSTTRKLEYYMMSILKRGTMDLDTYVFSTTLKLSIEDKKSICSSIINFYNIIKTKNILYLDLKLQNIILVDGEFKLIDFGSCCYNKSDAGVNKISFYKEGILHTLDNAGKTNISLINLEFSNIYHSFRFEITALNASPFFII